MDSSLRPDLARLEAVLGAPPLTRFAPSPTGYLHLGHVVNAIYVWGIARALGGRVLLRIEDHDRIRIRAEYEIALLEDLTWLGFEPDASNVAPPVPTRIWRSVLCGVDPVYWSVPVDVPGPNQMPMPLPVAVSCPELRAPMALGEP